jgi:hypothetical protein
MPSLEAESEALKVLLREAKALAARYYTLTRKPLGVTGEVAELEADEKLGLPDGSPHGLLRRDLGN